MPSSNFEIESPERVIKQAHEFKETLSRVLPLPVNQNKSMYVEKVVDYDIEQIKYSVTRAKYQNNLFRKLQKMDQQSRKKISQSLLLKQNKADKIHQKSIEQERKKLQMYSKHLNDVQKRYHEVESRKLQQQRQRALKFRQQIREFYDKQEQRKKLAQQSQVKVPPCYSNALEKIHQIQRANEQFAQRSQLELQKSFIRNNSEKKSELLKLRTTSLDFEKNESIYLTSQQIFKQKEDKFIQKNAMNELNSLKSFQHKLEQSENTKKRINEKIKRNTQKWMQQKRRIDDQNAEVPDRCTTRMQKTLHSSFRNTFSTFKDSFSKWRTTGEFNRSKIRQGDDRKKDQIMRIHEDLTLRNNSLRSIDDKMLSMRNRATKVAVQYL